MNIPVKDIISTIKQFNFRSVFISYWKSFTLIILVPFLILNLLVVYCYNRLTNERINDSVMNTATMTYDTISQIIETADQLFTQIQYSTYVEEYLTSNNAYDKLLPQNIYQQMTQSISKVPELNSIYLFNFSNSYVLATSGGNHIDDFRHTDWFKYYMETNTSNFIMKSSVYQHTTHSDRSLLTMCYGVYYQNICYGLVVINYDVFALDDLLLLDEGEHFFLLSENNSILYSNYSISEELSLSDYYHYEIPDKDFKLHHANSYITVSRKFAVKNLGLVFVSDLLIHSRQSQYLYLILGISLATAILLPMIISLYISLKFYHSIAEIIAGLGTLNASEEPKKYNDEVSFITKQIMSLSIKKSHAENELANKMVLLKKSQLSAMQLQFNQHFLFNTLNLISMSARVFAGSKNPTTKAISLLSELLRISLDTNSYLVPIHKEILYAQKYIEIEQLKLKNTFEVKWDIAEDISNYKIVKLIFQPIIENALRYGLQALPSDAEKLLTIRGRTTENKIFFNIIDNGPGFKPEVLKRIQNMLEAETVTGTEHIGLVNANMRIKLMFGDEYGLEIKSSEEGSNITISIPKVKNLN